MRTHTPKKGSSKELKNSKCSLLDQSSLFILVLMGGRQFLSDLFTTAKLRVSLIPMAGKGNILSKSYVECMRFSAIRKHFKIQRRSPMAEVVDFYLQRRC